jgi:disulfide bond formation protein DsbB
MTPALQTAFAVLAIILQVLLAGLALTALAALVSPAARRALVEMRETLLGHELWIAWAIALVATLGSLYFSEIAHYEPCRLCWYQRIFMYPLALLLLGMAARRDLRNVWLYALPIPVIGAAIAAYHQYVVINPAAESQGCKQGVSCTVRWFREFGYIELPTLSLTAFAAIVALLLMAHSRRRAARD